MNSLTLELHDPTGLLETTVPHAPRLDTLDGKTIVEVSNFHWEHQRIFPAVRAELQQRYPTAKFISYTEVSDIVSNRAELDDIENVKRLVMEKKCDAVITGMAA